MNNEEIPDSNFEPSAIISRNFGMQYGAIDRRINFVDFEVAEAEADIKSLKNKAYHDWKKYSEQFKKDAGAITENLGMLIYVMKGPEPVHIMIEQGETVEKHRLYFDYRGITGQGKVVSMEDSKKEEDLYSEEMIQTFINVATRSIDIANLNQSFKSNLS